MFQEYKLSFDDFIPPFGFFKEKRDELFNIIDNAESFYEVKEYIDELYSEFRRKKRKKRIIYYT